VKVVVDMNLSPSWIDRLSEHGFDAVHWSAIGAATARDDEILAWARTNGFLVLTHDLDFTAILAATADQAPSVVQLRMQDLLSESALEAVTSALRAHSEDIAKGALLSIDESGARVRILPLRRP
jgi:predicted nuclease of predicted toxin-antitoxin system